MAPWTKEEKAAFRAEHPVHMPVPQPSHNFPHADLATYFNAIYAADFHEYKGLISIAAKRIGCDAPQLIAVVPADQLGTWASQMHVSTRMDYYYGKAQHSGNATWGQRNMFAINSIGVDIDDHAPGSGRISADTKLIDNIILGLQGLSIPEPNIVEFTGRGYHLVWLIQQIPAYLSELAQQFAGHYAKAVEGILGKYGSVFSVDFGYATSVAGLTRIPGTYNTKAQAYATYELRHNSRLDLQKAHSVISVKKARNKHEQPVGRLGKNRLKALKKFAALRGDLTGKRHAFLLISFASAQAAGMSDQEAMDYVQKLNQSFPTPLSARDVERSMSSAITSRYKFKSTTIIEKLGIKPDEAQLIGLVQKKRDSNRARNERRRDERKKRDKAIMRLHLLGKTVSEITKQVNHAYNTVASVVRRYEACLSALFSKKELAHLRKQAAKSLITSINAPKAQQNTPFSNLEALYRDAYTGESSQQITLGLDTPFAPERGCWLAPS